MIWCPGYAILYSDKFVRDGIGCDEVIGCRKKDWNIVFLEAHVEKYRSLAARSEFLVSRKLKMVV